MPSDPPLLSINTVNAMDRNAFVDAFAHIIEHSPWVAERASDARPFADLNALHRAMIGVVSDAGDAEKLAILNAHPELAGREAQDATLTEESAAEQKSAGLTALTPEEMEKVSAFNRDYREKFGFPFIIAVKNHTKASILAEMARRRDQDRAAELETAIEQVYEIARIRLAQLVADA